MKENILNDSEVQSLINFVNSDEMRTNRRLKLTTLASVMECNNLNSEMRSDLLNASLLYQSHLIELLHLTNQSINLLLENKGKAKKRCNQLNNTHN